jgi:hypothetical protein
VFWSYKISATSLMDVIIPLLSVYSVSIYLNRRQMPYHPG